MARFKLAYRRRFTEAHSNLLMVDKNGLLLYMQTFSNSTFKHRELGIYETNLGAMDHYLLSLWDTIEANDLHKNSSGQDPGPGQLSVEFTIASSGHLVNHVEHALSELTGPLRNLEERVKNLISQAYQYPERTFTPTFFCETKKLRSGDEMRINAILRNRGRSNARIINPRIFGSLTSGVFRVRHLHLVHDPKYGDMWIGRGDKNLAELEFITGPRTTVPSTVHHLEIPAGCKLNFWFSYPCPKYPSGTYRLCIDYITFGDPIDEGENLVLGYFDDEGDIIELTDH